MSNQENPKSIVLAGGYGTRLLDVGQLIPKGLIEYQGTNLINRVVNELQKINIHEIAVVTNAKYFKQYQEWQTATSADVTLLNDTSTSPENRLGALGDLSFAINALGWSNEHILVAPSDTYFAFPLTSFQTTINQYPEEFVTIVRDVGKDAIKNRLGCAVISDTQLITDFVEKPESPQSPYAAIPFYYYPPAILGLLPQYQAEGNSMDAPGNLIPWLLKKSIPVHACVVTDTTIDVGTPAELALLQSQKSE